MPEPSVYINGTVTIKLSFESWEGKYMSTNDILTTTIEYLKKWQAPIRLVSLTVEPGDRI
jgi:hypothetical protein